MKTLLEENGYLKMEIICKYNNGYKWIEKSNIRFKGFLHREGKVYCGEEAVGKLTSLSTYTGSVNSLKIRKAAFLLSLSERMKSCGQQ